MLTYLESEAELDKARKDFDMARVVLETVKVFGSEDAMLVAKTTLKGCASEYVDCMVSHVRKMMEVVEAG